MKHNRKQFFRRIARLIKKDFNRIELGYADFMLKDIKTGEVVLCDTKTDQNAGVKGLLQKKVAAGVQNRGNKPKRSVGKAKGSGVNDK